MNPSLCSRKDDNSLLLFSVISSLSKKTLPLVGLSSAPSKLSSVVLPEPEGPAITRYSPFING